MQHWLKCTFTLASVSVRLAWNVYGSLFLREEEKKTKKGAEKRKEKEEENRPRKRRKEVICHVDEMHCGNHHSGVPLLVHLDHKVCCSLC